MSEKTRMGLLVLFFASGGLLLWNFQFRTASELPKSSVTEKPESGEKNTAPGFKADADYPDTDDEGAPDLPPKVGLAAVSKPNQSKSMSRSGPGVIRASIYMDDRSQIPTDLVITLHHIPDEAKFDGSINTVRETLKLNGKKDFEFSKLPLGQYVLFADSASYTGTTTMSVSNDRRASRRRLTLFPSSFISGTVVDKEGEPVTDAHVFVAKHSRGTTETSSNLYRSRASAVPTDEIGAFVMNGLHVSDPELRYRLVAIAKGYVPRMTELLATGSTDVEIVLGQGGSLSGIVVNQDSGNPVANEILRISSDAEVVAAKEIQTDEKGAFAVANLTAGTLRFSMDLEQEALTPESMQVQLAENESIDDLVLNVRAGGMISGRLFDIGTGEGIPDVSVEADGLRMHQDRNKQATTDSNGGFAFRGMHAGRYGIDIIEVKGYSKESAQGNSSLIAVALGKSVTGIEIGLARELSISGEVVDVDGNPVPNIKVRGTSKKGSGRDSQYSDEQGRFALTGFRKESTVEIRLGDWDVPHRPLDVNIIDQPVSDIQLVVLPEARISAKLLDSQGSPAPNVVLYVKLDADYSKFSSATTDSSGDIMFGGLEEGTYVVKQAKHTNMFTGNDTELGKVVVTEGQHSQGHRFVLHKSQDPIWSISGRITDDTGAPAELVLAKISGQRGAFNTSASTDSDGRYEFNNLKEGSYHINFEGNGFVPDMITKIEAGSVNADLMLTRTGSVSGLVLDPNGRPLTEFKIALTNSRHGNPSSNNFKQYRNEEGRFEIEGAFPGNQAAIHARAEGLAQTMVPVDGIRSGENTPNVLVRMESEHILSGQVVDVDGRPIAYVSIFEGRVPPSSYARNRAKKIATDPQGRFEMRNLPRGTIQISAFKNGFSPTSETIDISQPETTTTLILGNGGTLSGSVTLHGTPVPNIRIGGTITIDDGARHDISGNADADGHFSIRGLPAGSGRASVATMDGNAMRNLHKQIDVASGLETVVNFEFVEVTATLEGYLMASETETAAGSIFLRIDTGETEEVQVKTAGHDGHYFFESLPAGHFTLSSRRESDDKKKAVVGTLGEDDHLRVDIHSYGGAVLNVSVSNAPPDNRFAAFLLPPSYDVPETMDQKELSQLYRVIIEQILLVDNVASFKGVEKGSYTVLVAGASNTTPDADEFITTSKTVTIKDETNVEIEVSF
jgi:hypothetical protein